MRRGLKASFLCARFSHEQPPPFGAVPTTSVLHSKRHTSFSPVPQSVHSHSDSRYRTRPKLKSVARCGIVFSPLGWRQHTLMRLPLPTDASESESGECMNRMRDEEIAPEREPNPKAASNALLPQAPKSRWQRGMPGTELPGAALGRLRFDRLVNRRIKICRRQADNWFQRLINHKIHLRH